MKKVIDLCGKSSVLASPSDLGCVPCYGDAFKVQGGGVAVVTAIFLGKFLVSRLLDATLEQG